MSTLRSIFFLLCFGFISIGHSQSWFHHDQGENATRSSAMAIDAQGNLISAIAFVIGFDADPGGKNLFFKELRKTSTGDVCIQKLNTKGELIWAKQISTSYKVEVSSIATDVRNNIYI